MKESQIANAIIYSSLRKFVYKVIKYRISLERNLSNLSYIFLLHVNFKNLTIRLRVFNVLNTHVKFRSNRMVFYY